MVLAALGLIVTFQQVPARVVVLSATLGGKPYGTVTYVRQVLGGSVVPGSGIERTVTLEVTEGDAGYKIEEKRVYSREGAPVSTTRIYTQGERRVTVKVVFEGNKATVTHTDGAESEIDEVFLTEEGAVTTDASQTWFINGAPAVRTEARFWEFSLDDDAWVERKVRYEGTASLKIGEKTVTAHRISIGAETNFYVDDAGMPLKSVQKTSAGDLTLVRTQPEVLP